MGVNLVNLYGLPMDAISQLREDLSAEDNNSCLPWHEFVDNSAALMLRLLQRHLMLQQCRGFNSPPCSAKVQSKRGMSAPLSTFEERQAILVAEVLGRGILCNGNEAVQDEQGCEVGSDPECSEVAVRRGTEKEKSRLPLEGSRNCFAREEWC